MRNGVTVFTSKTGTGTSTEVEKAKLFRGQVRLPIMAKLALTYGGTPTITIKLQGLRSADETWEDLDTGTFTTGATKYLHSLGKLHGFRRYRLNITVNTNVTVDSASIGVGVTED